MNWRNSLTVLTLAWLCCSLGSAQDATAPTGPSNIADLDGQIVAITLMSDVDDLVLLSNVSEKKLGNKSFLSGKGVDDGETPDWRNDATVYIPLDDVQQIVTFPNLKAYQKNLDARHSRTEGKAASSKIRKRT